MHARNRVGGQSEATIDQCSARHDATFAAEAIFQFHLARANRTQETASLDLHAAPLQPNVGWCEVAGAGELVAGDLILGDEDRSIAKGFGKGNGDGTADGVEQRDRAVGQRGAVVHVDDVDHDGAGSDVVPAVAGPGTGALHNDFTDACCVVDVVFGFVFDVDSGRRALANQPLHQRRAGSGQCGDTTEVVGRLDQPNPMPTDGCHPGGLHAGDAATDDEHVAGPRCRRVPVRILCLAAAAGLAHAGHERVARVSHLTGLVAPDARADAVVLVAIG